MLWGSARFFLIRLLKACLIIKRLKKSIIQHINYLYLHGIWIYIKTVTRAWICLYTADELLKVWHTYQMFIDNVWQWGLFFQNQKRSYCMRSLPWIQLKECFRKLLEDWMKRKWEHEIAWNQLTGLGPESPIQKCT